MGRTRSFTAPVNSRCAYIFKKSKEVVAQQKDDPSSPQKLNPQASQAQNEGTQLPQTGTVDSFLTSAFSLQHGWLIASTQSMGM